MPRYQHADLLRSYERMNILSGANWLEAAAKRYNEPRLAPQPMGLDSAPPMTRGVDTLAYVGDDADGLGGFLDLQFSSQQKMMAVAALAYHGYKRSGSYEGAALWAVLGLIQPLVAGGLALYAGFGTSKAQSKFKVF